MRDNNIAVALDALGEKIFELNNDLAFEQMRYKQLANENEELKKEYENLKRKHDSLTARLNAYCDGGTKNGDSDSDYR